ncbi:MAG: flagellar export chaperone FliS [Defluviitaleaceae bacterium]|nr:flagellar export chaperone FliS [Defluviitaleaceae bacterium]
MNNPYAAIRENAVLTATKEELTLMLYDGALRFCNQAIVALEKKDYGKTNDYLLKVQNIIQEFRLTLDKRYEIAAQLDALYDYLYSRLIEANMKKDMGILEEIRDHLRGLRDTWKDAMKISRTTSGAGQVRS